MWRVGHCGIHGARRLRRQPQFRAFPDVAVGGRKPIVLDRAGGIISNLARCALGLAVADAFG
eukprot:6867426-Lingulodinium_polyedra.AAC.1